MIITNKYNLPEAFMGALKAHDDEYQGSRGETDISATQLIKPPLVLQLYKQKDGEIIEDVSDRIYSIFGSAVHKILEENTETTGTAEQRLFMDCDGWKVSAQGDHLSKDGVLSDYKVTGVFKVQLGDYEEYEEQLNVLCYLYKEAGLTVEKLQIVALVRDWSIRKKRFARLRGQVYPDAPAVVIPIPMWTSEKTHLYIKERVALHKRYEGVALEDIEECTPKEKWQSPSTYAVMKKGQKNAIRGGVCDTLAQAYKKLEEMEKKSGEFYIEERPEEEIRCADYCHPELCPYKKEK